MRNINLDASRIGKLQQSSMVDTCRINIYSETNDEYKDLVKGWTSGSMSGSSICGVSTSSGNKTYKDQGILIKSDATIRLPLTTTICEQDTITVTRQNNTTTLNQTYTIDNIGIGHGELIIKAMKLQV